MVGETMGLRLRIPGVAKWLPIVTADPVDRTYGNVIVGLVLMFETDGSQVVGWVDVLPFSSSAKLLR